MHTFIKDLKNKEIVDGIYFVNYKNTNVNNIYKAKNGNKYIILKIKDASLSNNECCALFYYFNDESDIAFLKDDFKGRSPYIKIYGRCFSTFPDAIIFSNNVVSAKGMVFDTSNLFSYSEYFEMQLLSYEGKLNVPLRNTSSEAFQSDYDLIDEGTELRFERIYNSPYDKYQINVFIDGIDERFNIPAYLSPTMGKLIDEGYKFKIIVQSIPAKTETMNAGIRVKIKGSK